MNWCIESSEEHGRTCWTLQDAPGNRGTVWATFYDRIAATACLRGFKVIGFVSHSDLAGEKADPVTSDSRLAAAENLLKHIRLWGERGALGWGISANACGAMNNDIDRFLGVPVKT